MTPTTPEPADPLLLLAAQQQAIDRLQRLADEHSAQIATALAAAGTGVLLGVASDRALQRLIVGAIILTLLLITLAVPGFALLGNATAKQWVAASPAALAAAALWVSHAGAVPLTRKEGPP